ncbi:MAG: hypothetical protein WCO60_09275 [Verrucomicrobiota bacterium]
MKKHILTYLSSLILTASALAHGDVELGPNGGRLLEFSKNESMHGEVVFKDNQFQIALLDKDKKPVALVDQELTATTGDRAKPEKLVVEKGNGKFVVPAVKAGEWIIFQFKENAKAKAITARLQYDLTVCSACKEPEWLCKCAAKDAKGKK